MQSCFAKAFWTFLLLSPLAKARVVSPTLTPANVPLLSSLLVNGTCYRIMLQPQHHFPRSKETI